VAAYGGVNLQRNLIGNDDRDAPAELFEFAPELFFLYPKDLRIPKYNWEEVAP